MKSISRLLLSGLVCSGTILNAGLTQADETPSLDSGVYNEAQATRGQALYYQYCLKCHGEMMNGLDQAPPLAGPQFSNVWNGVPLTALVARIMTMPPDKPGSVSRAESVDILTYMLWFNGLPLGNDPLDEASDALQQLKFQPPQAAN